MSRPTPSIDEVFFAAMERESPEARAAYLDEVCGSDPDLRRRVERLLDAQPKVGSFLDSPAAGATMTLPPPQAMEGPGTVIGPYKLLEQIGEGGMGVVYMAEQTEPVRRKVALKIIKPGMDTRQVIARFEAERQALAMMDHPNIAKVLDAGATESGRPYFVMELVRGIPITEYCDQHRLPIRERLDLFMQVCQAVQHAHQKGIIHRDIKPTNVLVTSLDGVPLPRVIDFGIAKATGQSLTDKTLFTGFAQLIGTPLYMSPEQAELSAVDIDTRSDIYSLGVLLYELLTGTTPFRPGHLPHGRARRDPADHPRGRAAQAEHAAQCVGRDPDDRLGQPPDRRPQAEPLAARRAGLDRDEGAGEGPQPPLRDGQRPGPRRRALPGRRPGRGRPALGLVSPPQVRPAQPRGPDDDGSRRPGPDRRHDRERLAGHPRPARPGRGDLPARSGGDKLPPGSGRGRPHAHRGERASAGQDPPGRSDPPRVVGEGGGLLSRIPASR